MAFDAEWLALREPADHAARDATLLTQAAAAAGATPCFLDLACGTGSTFRAFADRARADATWRVLDNDRDLLDLAEAQAPERTEACHLDLADPAALPLKDVTLVTASALLDLVSVNWLKGLVATLCARHLPFYAALTYDGRMIWDPQHEEDDHVTAAFNAHQRTDKGFGPALGPDATSVARKLFSDQGYEVRVAQSDWTFPAQSTPLKETLTRDIASAASEAGYRATADWQAQRASRALRVGHLDLLAVPRGSRGR